MPKIRWVIVCIYLAGYPVFLPKIRWFIKWTAHCTVYLSGWKSCLCKIQNYIHDHPLSFRNHISFPSTEMNSTLFRHMYLCKSLKKNQITSLAYLGALASFRARLCLTGLSFPLLPTAIRLPVLSLFLLLRCTCHQGLVLHYRYRTVKCYC